MCGYVGDPLQKLIYGGIKPSDHCIYDERTDTVFVLVNSYNLEIARLYQIDCSTNTIQRKTDLRHSFILKGKIALFGDCLFFKEFDNQAINLVRMDLRSHITDLVTSFTDDVEDFIIDNDTVYLEIWDGKTGNSAIKVLNLLTGGIDEFRLGEGRNKPICSQEGELFYIHTDYLTPPEIFVYKKGISERLTQSSSVALERRFHSIQMKTLITENGLTCKCYYSKETEGRLRPSLIWLHGGPQILSCNQYTPFELWLCSLGYTVYVPAYRGTLGLGKKWALGARGKNLGRTDLQDVWETVEKALDPALSDVCKVGVAGVSYGGYLALRSAANIRNLKAVFCFGAICDWRIQQENTDAKNYDYWLLENWYKKTDVDSVSPCFEIDNIRIPVMITHGALDIDVPYCQVTAYKELAEYNNKKNIEFYFYYDEGHGLPGYRAENYYHWHKLLEKFLRKYI